MKQHMTGDLLFIRDCLNTAIVEIGEAEEITDIYALEDLVDVLKEAIRVADGLMDMEIEE